MPGADLTDSKRIAGLLGPALITMIASESKWVNPHLYDTQIPPVVYLSGMLLFVAGLSIVRVHNRWTGGWTVVITLMGWLAMILGLFRMFAPAAYLRGAQNNDIALSAIEIVLLGIGMYLTFKAYSREGG
jgi:hypothetical protein